MKRSALLGGIGIIASVLVLIGLGGLSQNRVSSLHAAAGNPATSANLTVTQTALPSVTLFAAGQTPLYFTANVTNNGVVAANDVQLIHPVPTGTTFFSSTSPACALSGNMMVCNLGTINAGVTSKVTFQFRKAAGQSCFNLFLQNMAAAWTTSLESNYSDNASLLNMSVTCPAAGTATLDIIEKTLPTTGNSTTGAKNLLLKRFEAKAGAKNIQFNGVTFVAAPDVAANGQNYTLQVDTNNDMIADSTIQSIANANAGRVQFDLTSIDGYSIFANSTVTFEVHADVAPTLTASKFLRTWFDTPQAGYSDDMKKYVKAKEADTGNDLVGINTYGACASTCQIYTQVLPSTVWNLTDAARLDVSVKHIGSNETVVANQKNVTLMRYEGRHTHTADVLVSKVSFVAQAGSVSNAESYALWADVTDDGIVDAINQGHISSVDGKVTFDLPFFIPTGKTVAFEIHADIAPSLQGNQLQLAFDTLTANYIEAVKDQDGGTPLIGISTNGACAGSCQMYVSTVPSKIYTIVNSGDLFVIRDDVVRSRQLLGGALSEDVLRINFRAQNEDIDVTDIQISTWDSIGTSVDRLELYKPGEATAFASATVGGCGSDIVPTVNAANGKAIKTFCSNTESHQLVVPEGQNVDVLIKAQMKDDNSGAISNESLKFWLSKKAVATMIPGEGAVRARGMNSAVFLEANDGDSTNDGEIFIGTNTVAPNNDVIGNPNVSVLSKITSITNANPDANNSAVPVGVRPIGQFKFTAAANSNSKNGLNKVTFTDMIFTINATNVFFDEGGFKLYNKTNTSVKVPCEIREAYYPQNPPPFHVTCSDFSELAVSADFQVDSGMSDVFVLEASILNPQITSANSTLQVLLDKFNDMTLSDVNSSSSHIRWEDVDASAASIGFLWIEYPDSAIHSTLYRT